MSSTKFVQWGLIAIILAIVCYFAHDAYLEYQDTQRVHEAVTAQAESLSAKSRADPRREVERTQQVIKSQAYRICREGEPCPSSGPERIIERIVEREVCTNQDTSLEFDAIIVKLKMQNESSWMAIIKLLVAMLVAVFGIKIINLLFRRWEL